MTTRAFEELVNSLRDPLWLAVCDLTGDELVQVMDGGSPEVIARLEEILGHGPRDMIRTMRARPREPSGEATEAARAKLLRHLDFYETGILGRPLGRFLVGFHGFGVNRCGPGKVLQRFHYVNYRLQIRVGSLMRRLIKGWLDRPAR